MKTRGYRLSLYLIAFWISFLVIITPSLSENLPVKAGVSFSENQERVNWQWWENFKDEALLDSLKKSVDNNFDVLIADLKTDEAWNYVESSQRNRAPHVSAGVEFLEGRSSRIDHFGRMRVVSNSSQNMIYLPLEFTYEFDFWGRKKDEREFWSKNKSFKEFEKNFVILSTLSDVSSLYFNILKNEKLIGFHKEIRDLRQKKLEMNLEKFNLRLTSRQKIIDLKKELSEAQEELITLQAQNEELKNRFYFLVFGNKERGTIAFKNLDDIELFCRGDMEISSSKLANRPDILMAEEQIRLAKLDAELARKELLPKFVLTGDIYQISKTFNDFLGSQSVMYRSGSGILFDFFKKGKNHGVLKAKKSVYKQALKEYEKTIVCSINDVNNSLSYLKSSVKNYEQAQAVSVLDRENLDIEKEKLLLNLITYDKYIAAQERFIASQMAEFKLKTECLVHTISLYKALGGNV